MLPYSCNAAILEMRGIPRPLVMGSNRDLSFGDRLVGQTATISTMTKAE